MRGHPIVETPIWIGSPLAACALILRIGTAGLHSGRASFASANIFFK